MKTPLTLIAAVGLIAVALSQPARPAPPSDPNAASGRDGDMSTTIRSLAVGDLDLSFGGEGTGLVTTDVGGFEEAAYGVAIQPDGKIVTVGSSVKNGRVNFALVRYDRNGIPDPSFGLNHNGKVITPVGSGSAYAYGVAIQMLRDGTAKIIVVGEASAHLDSDFALARYNLDGVLDPSFGTEGTGLVITPIGPGDDTARAIAIQTLRDLDGSPRIVVAGTSYNGRNEDFAVVRYDADGRLDPSFGPRRNGIATMDFGAGTEDMAYGIAIHPAYDWTVVVGSTRRPGSNADFAVACYTRDGMPQTLFSPNGRVTTAIGSGDDIAYSVAIQELSYGRSRIVVAGESFNGRDIDFALVRYDLRGRLDPSFGINGNGLLWTNFPAPGPSDDKALGLAIRPADGQIAVAGYCSGASNHYDFALALYTDNGWLMDKVATDFGSSMDVGLAVALQPSDHKIVVAGTGNTQFAAARYEGGAPDVPSVTVAVAPAAVSEDGTARLIYTFTLNRPSDLVSPDVDFSVTGTASYGTDYTQAGAWSFAGAEGAVEVLGGVTARVAVSPVPDRSGEPDETVILTVIPGFGYTVGTPSAATGTIQDAGPGCTLVDDMESYNADQPIYRTWLDGRDNGTGSQVGYAEPPFVEQTIVHSGGQSLPFYYDNTARPYDSEASRHFTLAQNWTARGATTLSLWVRGQATNTADQLRVTLRDSRGRMAVVSHPDPAITRATVWTQWQIPLSSFTGVNPTGITVLSLGIGDGRPPRAGSRGLLFVDDIRVCAP